jgi:opacity protein-like surface antigen
MMKKYFLAAAALAALMTSAAAQTSTRSFYDNRGSFAGGIVWNGQSWTRGNTTSFSNGRGQLSGFAIRHGNSTSFYDGRGRYIGSGINTSPRR